MRIAPRLERIFVALTVCVFVVSIFTHSAFPIEDSAFFEYYGRALTHGTHLYTELWDNKLPSIYYLNAFLWLAFGGNFALHELFETVISGATIVLFALLLRSFNVERWAIGTLAFAILYVIVGGPYNQTEHYATPLILAALLASVRGWDVITGILLVAASTFWLPSAIVGLVPLLTTLAGRRRWTLLLTTAVTGLLYASAFIFFFHVSTTEELIASWLPYASRAYGPTVERAHRPPFLAPRYYIQSGLALMVFLIAIFWQRRAKFGPRHRFAYLWAASSLLIAFATGRPYVHYFLPAYPSLAMIFALQPITPIMLGRRWYFSSAAAICVGVMIFAAILDERQIPPTLAYDAVYTGNVILRTFGDRTTGVLPWEVYLTSDATPPTRFTFSRDTDPFARARDIWPASLDLVVRRKESSQSTQLPGQLSLACQNAFTNPWVIFTNRPVSGMSCTPLHKKVERLRLMDRRGSLSKTEHRSLLDLLWKRMRINVP